MKLTIITSLILTTIPNISIAGNGNSKATTKIVIPSVQKLTKRANELSINIQDLNRLEIFEAFAGKEINSSEIETEVDQIFSERWREHLSMISRVKNASHNPAFLDQLLTQNKEYERLRKTLKPVIIKILLEQAPKR